MHYYESLVELFTQFQKILSLLFIPPFINILYMHNDSYFYIVLVFLVGKFEQTAFNEILFKLVVVFVFLVFRDPSNHSSIMLVA